MRVSPPSALPVSAILLSGEKATEVIPPRRPRTVCVTLPVPTSHSLVKASALPVMNVLPFGESLTLIMRRLRAAN